MEPPNSSRQEESPRTNSWESWVVPLPDFFTSNPNPPSGTPTSVSGPHPILMMQECFYHNNNQLIKHPPFQKVIVSFNFTDTILRIEFEDIVSKSLIKIFNCRRTNFAGDSKLQEKRVTLVFEHSAKTENTNPKIPQKRQRTITAVPALLPSFLLLPWISISACVTAIFSPPCYFSFYLSPPHFHPSFKSKISHSHTWEILIQRLSESKKVTNK